MSEWMKLYYNILVGDKCGVKAYCIHLNPFNHISVRVYCNGMHNGFDDGYKMQELIDFISEQQCKIR